jgi:hypothetical protein
MEYATMKFLNPKARKGTSRLVRRTMKHMTNKRDLLEEMSDAEARADEQEWRMKTTRERQIARLDNIHRRIADFQKYPRPRCEAQKARWSLLIEERDRVQSALNHNQKSKT